MTDRELMQMALDALQESKPIDIDNPAAFYRSTHAIEALRARLAQPEQEPKPQAWMLITEEGLFGGAFRFRFDAKVAARELKSRFFIVPLYAAPPQREWVGLTDGEMSEAYNVNYNRYGQHVEYADFVLVYAAIEAKLKEKNT